MYSEMKFQFNPTKDIDFSQRPHCKSRPPWQRHVYALFLQWGCMGIIFQLFFTDPTERWCFKTMLNCVHIRFSYDCKVRQSGAIEHQFQHLCLRISIWGHSGAPYRIPWFHQYITFRKSNFVCIHWICFKHWSERLMLNIVWIFSYQLHQFLWSETMSVKLWISKYVIKKSEEIFTCKFHITIQLTFSASQSFMFC